MCLLCIELTKDKLNKNDFIKNYIELVLVDPEHAQEVLDKWDEKYTEDLFEIE